MHVQQDNHSYHCHVVRLKIAKRVNPKSAHHKERHFSSLSLCFPVFI